MERRLMRDKLIILLCASASFAQTSLAPPTLRGEAPTDTTKTSTDTSRALPTLPSPFHPQRSGDEKSFKGRIASARLSERRGELNRAETAYLALIEQNPQHPLPYHRLGVLAGRQGRFRQAYKYFHQALRLGEPSPDLLNDMGYAFYLGNELRKAEYILRQALAKEPSHEGANNNLGLVLGEQGRFQESLTAFMKAVPDAEAYANLAYVYSQHGDLDKAMSNYSHALTLDKELKHAAKALIQVADMQKTQRQIPVKIKSAAAEATSGEQPLLTSSPLPPSGLKQPGALAQDSRSAGVEHESLPQLQTETADDMRQLTRAERVPKSATDSVEITRRQQVESIVTRHNTPRQDPLHNRQRYRTADFPNSAIVAQRGPASAESQPDPASATRSEQLRRRPRTMTEHHKMPGTDAPGGSMVEAEHATRQTRQQPSESGTTARDEHQRRLIRSVEIMPVAYFRSKQEVTEAEGGPPRDQQIESTARDTLERSRHSQFMGPGVIMPVRHFKTGVEESDAKRVLPREQQSTSRSTTTNDTSKQFRQSSDTAPDVTPVGYSEGATAVPTAEAGPQREQQSTSSEETRADRVKTSSRRRRP